MVDREVFDRRLSKPEELTRELDQLESFAADLHRAVAADPED